MSKTKQQAPRRLELTEEELNRVLKRKKKDEDSKVPPEELFMAEFGYYYGWGGVTSLINNELSLDDANVLLNGARKVWNAKMVDLASIIFTAAAASQSGKKAAQVMRTGLKEFVKQAKADQ